MNAVEIEEAISNLAEGPFDAENFPYAFLEAFGNQATTIKKLKSGNSNSSDIQGGVLQRNNIHILVCGEGEVTEALARLKASQATTKAKAKFILATDGIDLEAEGLTTDEIVACSYKDFPDHFGFFLPLAGITPVKQIRENAFDIKATSRLNRLYIELIKDNPEWGSAERRHDMNHFMARLNWGWPARNSYKSKEIVLGCEAVKRATRTESVATWFCTGLTQNSFAVLPPLGLHRLQRLGPASSWKLSNHTPKRQLQNEITGK